MIQGISFHDLDYETLAKNSEFNPLILSDTHLTRIGDTAVLPFDCYPNIKRPDGVYKDNLHKLYNDLYKSIQNESNAESDVEKQKNAVIQEIQKIGGKEKMDDGARTFVGKDVILPLDLC